MLSLRTTANIDIPDSVGKRCQTAASLIPWDKKYRRTVNRQPLPNGKADAFTARRTFIAAAQPGPLQLSFFLSCFLFCLLFC